MALSNLTKVQTVGIGSNIEVVGVVTTGQFKSGTSNLHSTGVELTNLNVSGIATIGGNLSVGGVLTYEDVTNIDSIGIVTARAGVNVSGGQLDVGSNIKLGNAGVITATSFVGNLTGNVTGNISGGTVAGSTGTFTGDVSIADAIVHSGDNSKIRFPSNDTITFETSGNEGVRIDAGGRLLVGTNAARTFGGGEYAHLQVEGTTQSGAQITITRNTNDTYSANLSLCKTRGTSDGAVTTVQDNDSLGTIQFRGADGSDVYAVAASIHGEVDGSPSDGTDMPGALVFGTTADGAASPTERLRIDSNGRALIGGGSSPAHVGDAQLQVYSSDRLHPAIKCAGTSNNHANGWTMLGDNYQADESNVNLGISYSSASLVLSRCVKVSGSADNTYLSSQDSYATRPCAIRLDDLGAFNFLTTETNATVATDSAVSLTEVFKIDRVGNIYQRTTDRHMYFGAGNVLKIGTNGSDPMIDAVSGDLQIKDAGNSICVVRSDGFQMYQGIYPAADNTYDLGKSSYRWKDLFVGDAHFSNKGSSNDVDGTWGDWTLQEGESKIFMINNRTGKKYSLKMEEE